MTSELPRRILPLDRSGQVFVLSGHPHMPDCVDVILGFDSLISDRKWPGDFWHVVIRFWYDSSSDSFSDIERIHEKESMYLGYESPGFAPQRTV